MLNFVYENNIKMYQTGYQLYPRIPGGVDIQPQPLKEPSPQDTLVRPKKNFCASGCRPSLEKSSVPIIFIDSINKN